MNRCVLRSCLAVLTLLASDLARVQAQPTGAATPVTSASSGAREDGVGLSPTPFWFAASATIISASLGGFYALRVRDLYDQAKSLARVSPERLELRDQMQSAELTADVLFASSLVLAIGTTLLAFQVDWRQPDAQAARGLRAPAQSRWRLAPLLLPGEQSLRLHGTLP
jgi:hypothetical protein